LKDTPGPSAVGTPLTAGVQLEKQEGSSIGDGTDESVPPKDDNDKIVTMSSTPPKPQEAGFWVFTLSETINYVIQLIAVITALIFGAWAIKSYDVTQHANQLSNFAIQQSMFANQLALLSFCNSDVVGKT